MSYVITTDSLADLPESYLSQHDVSVIRCCFECGEESYEDRPDNSRIAYRKLRDGEVVITSQYTPVELEEFFSQIIEKRDCDIVHVAFSSALSGSCANAVSVAAELGERYPGRQIKVIDSLGATLGEGIVVRRAVELKEQGMELDELVKTVIEFRYRAVHLFTVDSLTYLQRGGRLSKTAAIAGTLLHIKPVLHVDNEGHLVPMFKVKGRKVSLDKMCETMKQKLGSHTDENTTIYITHGDCADDAKYLEDKIRREIGFKNFEVRMLGPAIGAHSGPGTVALFFIGEER